MIRKIFIYGGGIFFSKIIVFFMIPIYTRVFPTDDFGYYDVLVQNLQMLTSIAFLEIWSGLLRFVFDDKLKAIRTTIKILPFLTMVYAVLYILLSMIIILKYPCISFAYGLAYLGFNVSGSICRGYDDSWLYVIMGVINTGISCILSIVFTVIMNLGIEYILIAQIIGFIIASAYVERKTRAYISAATSCESLPIKDFLVYCFPLMINSFSFMFLDTYNKNVVLLKNGELYSGYYGYVSKYSTILAIIVSVYSLAWQETAFSSIGKKKSENQVTYYIDAFISIFGFGTPIVSCLFYWLSPWIGGTQYLESNIYIPLALFTAIFAGISGVMGTILAAQKNTKTILYTTFIGAMVNVFVANCLISTYGINASSFALLLGYGTTSYLRYRFAKYKTVMEIDCIRILGVIVCNLAVFMCVEYNDVFLLPCLVLLVCIWFKYNREYVFMLFRNTSKMLNAKR